MIRRDNWKLIYYACHEPGELYNLDEDPHEAQNLYLAPKHRALRSAARPPQIQGEAESAA
jgi:arylsulfatase A-like enzyme